MSVTICRLFIPARRMNSKQTRVDISLERAVGFLSALARHKDDVKLMSPRLLGLLKRLELAVAKARATAGHKTFATRNRTGSTNTIGRAKQQLLVKHLRPIARDGLSLLKGMPGLREALRLPKRDASVAEYLKAARRIQRFVRPLVHVFIEADHAPDFLAQLGAAMKGLAEAGKDPGATRARSSRAVAQLKLDLAAAREVIGRIDSAIAVDFAQHPHLRHLWRQAKRIPPRQGRPPTKRKRKDTDADS
jgi:hypothetical protein